MSQSDRSESNDPAREEPTEARSRVTTNLVGSVIGIVLVGGGLVLALRFVDQIFAGLTDYNADADAGAAILAIIGALLVAAPALLTRWAPWAPIVPGFILAGLSAWAMTTNGLDGGAGKIATATDWVFDQTEFAEFCIHGGGLIVGLTLLFSGIAAALPRAGVRRGARP